MTGADLDLSNLIASRRREIEASRRARLAGAIVYLVVVAVLTAVLVADIASADEPPPVVGFGWPTGTTAAEHAERLDAFLIEFFAKCSPRKLARAREVVPVLLAEASAADVNPALVAAIVTLESTWRADALGQRGEVGLMQINRDGASTDPATNLREGIAILRHSYDVCGTTVGAVSYYATGSTCEWSGAARRMRLAQRIEEVR